MSITPAEYPHTRETRPEGTRPGRVVPLTDWVEARIPLVRERWHTRLTSRGNVGGEWGELVGSFVTLVSTMFVAVLGPLRREVEPLWDRLAELFGRTAAGRGLAAGEVIEELQILRELVLRELYRDPHGEDDGSPALRDVILMNRAIDRLVTYGSVGHTDALFFRLLGDEDDAELAVDTSVEAVEAELSGIRAELRTVLSIPVGETLAGVSEH